MVQFAKLLRNKNKRVDKIIELNYTQLHLVNHILHANDLHIV